MARALRDLRRGLLSGRLDNEWLLASRRWVLLAWGFLSLGNMLGMYWSYLELGWGGYWAWDPVENASFFAWLTGTAVLHSAMIQERRGILKVWNVGLMLTTYVLTVFGTFLTRAGLNRERAQLRAERHRRLPRLVPRRAHRLLPAARRVAPPGPPPRERISPFAFVVAGSFGALAAVLLIVSGVDFPIEDYVVVVGFFPALLGVMKLIEIVRLDGLSLKAQEGKKPRGIESLLSREFAFLLNNWIFVAMLVIVLVFTTFPLVSEVLEGVTVTIGPAVYNHWMVPFGLILLFLSGIGPLISWRKATGKNLLEAFRIPVLAMLAVAVLHVLVGPWLGVPPFVETTEIYDNFTGQALAAMMGISPFVSFALCGFVTATILQEFWRGTKVRMRTKKEPAAVAMFQLVSRARRRYGGYIVHLGIVGMFIGFTGAAYDVETEASVRPGQSLSVADYEFRYDAVRTSEDPNKQMVFADVSIFRAGQPLGVAHPARFVYRTHPDMPTTEVDIVESLRNDLYVIMSGVDTRTEEAQFRVVVRPLVMWIWLGGAVLLLGCFIAFVPTLREILGEARQPKRVPARGALAAATTLLIVLVLLLFGVSAASAQSDSSSSLHAGTVVMQTSEERQLFERLLCECGDCQRLPLSTCGCSWAEGMRAEVRAKMERGDSIPTITDDYRDRFGAQALAIPADEGLSRSMWLLPLAAAVLAGLGLVTWARRSRPADDADSDDGESGYDQRLEDELSAFEGD